MDWRPRPRFCAPGDLNPPLIDSHPHHDAPSHPHQHPNVHSNEHHLHSNSKTKGPTTGQGSWSVQHKPTGREKQSGAVEEIFGKITHNPSRTAEGQSKQLAALPPHFHPGTPNDSAHPAESPAHDHDQARVNAYSPSHLQPPPVYPDHDLNHEAITQERVNEDGKVNFDPARSTEGSLKEVDVPYSYSQPQHPSLHPYGAYAGPNLTETYEPPATAHPFDTYRTNSTHSTASYPSLNNRAQLQTGVYRLSIDEESAFIEDNDVEFRPVKAVGVAKGYDSHGGFPTGPSSPILEKGGIHGGKNDEGGGDEEQYREIGDDEEVTAAVLMRAGG